MAKRQTHREQEDTDEEPEEDTPARVSRLFAALEDTVAQAEARGLILQDARVDALYRAQVRAAFLWDVLPSDGGAREDVAEFSALDDLDTLVRPLGLEGRLLCTVPEVRHAYCQQMAVATLDANVPAEEVARLERALARAHGSASAWTRTPHVQHMLGQFTLPNSSGRRHVMWGGGDPALETPLSACRGAKLPVGHWRAWLFQALHAAEALKLQMIRPHIIHVAATRLAGRAWWYTRPGKSVYAVSADDHADGFVRLWLQQEAGADAESPVALVRACLADIADVPEAAALVAAIDAQEVTTATACLDHGFFRAALRREGDTPQALLARPVAADAVIMGLAHV